MSEEIIINTEKALYDYIELLRSNFDEHKYLRVDMKTGKQRTGLQNRSLHLYCGQLAQMFNNDGLTFTAFFKEGFELSWTPEIVKDNIWRKVQLAMTGEDSTTKPKTSDYPKIYEVVNRKLASLGYGLEWPNKDR